jgi:predicted enzyme related to lactoylglutathione lyase
MPKSWLPGGTACHVGNGPLPDASRCIVLHCPSATSVPAVSRLTEMVATSGGLKEKTMATSRLRDIVFDCDDQRRVGRFWAEVLGYALRPEPADAAPDDPVVIVPPQGGIRIWFNSVPEPKVGKNRVHIDIDMPDAAEMERLRRLGARVLREIHADYGTLAWTIMADPEGNEFCAFPPGQ